MHQHLLAMVPIFMLGMALAYAYHISRNIWLPIALHAINNSISILGVYYGNEDDLNANWFVTLAALFVIVFVVQQKPPVGEVIEEEE
jgi:membrane protease YdiL (CAAX protease family)